MTDRAGIFPIICAFAMLLAPTIGRAADEPAATAAIPPPAPPVVVHKASPPAPAIPHKAPPPAAATHNPPWSTATATADRHARPQRHASAIKKNNARTAARVATAHKLEAVVQRHARHHAIERRPVVVRAIPRPPRPPQRAYAGVPMLEPEGPPPPLLPPWYDRARPAIAYAFPPRFIGPRGPLPPWWAR